MPLPVFSPYTFGCMSIGQELDDIDGDVALVREAMEAGIWFHCSPTYHRGFSFMMLRMAFEQAPSSIPPLIVKVRDGSPAMMRFEAEDACRRLGVDGIDVAQLVSMDSGPDNLVAQLLAGDGPLVEALADLREREVIRHATLFVQEHNCDQAADTLQTGLIDGLTCYWNAYQRKLTPEVWARIQADEIGLVAIRTLAGAGSDPDPEQHQRVLVAMEGSGCVDEVEFALRLAATYSGVRTTIGGTRNPAHLRRFLEAAEQARPLPEDAVSGLFPPSA